MSDMTTAGIIARLEKATGPDRDLEMLIFGIGANPLFNVSLAPPYTSSIDAALTLVPEGWRYGFEQAGMFDGNDLCEAWVWPFEDSFEPDWRNGDQGYRSCENAKRGAHKLPAISICIAALKAREEQ